MRRPQQGFTLIEVLVSVAILALALGSVIVAGSRYVDNTVYLREKTLATWIAHNVIVEAILLDRIPGKGKEDDEVEFAGLKWTWEAEVHDTPDPDLRRFEVSVWPEGADEDDEAPLIKLSAFVPRAGGE